MKFRRSGVALAAVAASAIVTAFAVSALPAQATLDGGSVAAATTSPSPTPTPTTPGNEGCTPGFWKNHPGAWQLFSPGQRLDTVFFFGPALSDFTVDTLGDALAYRGGPGVNGAVRILLRSAVASLLNSAHSGVDFSLSTTEVINQVNAALASEDRETILALASRLDAANNAGCRL